MAEQNTTEIKDTDYITVKRDDKGHVGVFVGGKPATHYRGHKIVCISDVISHFVDIEKEIPGIEELQIMSSQTKGEYCEIGDPVYGGQYVWCRVKLKGKDLSMSPWVYFSSYDSSTQCAEWCAIHCCANVWLNPWIRWALLGVNVRLMNPWTRHALWNTFKKKNASERRKMAWFQSARYIAHLRERQQRLIER